MDPKCGTIFCICRQTELPIPKRDHQERIAIETQTDWEWVISAVANQSLKEEEREEMVEEEESEESGEQDSSDDDDDDNDDDERLLSFNSTKSSELISSSTPPSVREVATPPCLPNVGPPKILQYCRESEKDIVNIKENKVSIVLTKNSMGLCEFCENPTKPLPTLEQESTQCPEELYCCEEYQKFLEMVLQNETEEARLRLEIEKSTKECLKSGKSPPKTKILNKKELKNKVKAREMKLKQKQQESFQQQQQQQQQIPPQGYHTTRQMNTINYQLSSRRCLEEGWTVRTPYLEQLDFDGDIFEVEPGKRIALWRGAESISEGPLEKFYDIGHKFFTIFADGTGNIFYPSGCLAVLITATQPCHFTYVIYHEATVKRRVAAIFEHTGYGTCYHANGNVRLYIDPSGGVEADEGGVIKRRWHWHQAGSHVHAPPLQPIHIALNKFIGIKVVSQCNIQLNFIAKRRSCKINMGVNVKPVNVLKPTSVVDENHFYLEDKKANIECLLSKVRNLIQYGHSPKLKRILPPIYLTNKTSKLQQQAKQLTHTKKRPKVIVRSEIPSYL
ncbi:unnamed protein product [Acanthosepion pharaonis]|uniref:FAM194 C-terminal domain-containing protein n=1 Tax=Acanthosepion pharaonis TaxID=158019 RepID=A0A812DLR9_ACAPH|nr:unnamed protein product [Sepia pharaonis]